MNRNRFAWNVWAEPSSHRDRVIARAFRSLRVVALRALILSFVVVVGCDSSQLSLEEIDTLHAQGRWHETIESLRLRVEDGDRDPKVLLRYGVALSQTGSHSLAFWPLREAAKDPDAFEKATMLLAAGAYNTGNHDLAIEHLDELLERVPEKLNALKMRCMSRLHTRRDYEGALDDAGRALDLDPGASDMLSARIVALLGLKRIDEARIAIDAFDSEALFGETEEREDWTDLERQAQVLACIGRAKFAFEDGSDDLAAERFSSCLEAYPAESLAVAEAAKFFTDRGEIERVDEIFAAAYEAAPEDRSFRIAMARRQEALGNLDRAKEILEEGADGEYPRALIDLAGYLAAHEEVERAIEIYRDAQSKGASGAQFLLAFGELLISTGRFDEALATADQVGPESHKALIRGRVALKRAEYQKALDLLTEGIELWPDNAVARYYTALAAEGVGDFDRAIEEYRNALRIDADAADSRERLARLHLAEANPQAALYIIRYQGGMEQSSVRRSLPVVRIELEAVGALGHFLNLPPDLLERISSPGIWGESVAAVARGIRSRQGEEDVVSMIIGADRLDLTSAPSAPALAELIKSLSALKRFDEAIERARSAVDANSDNAEFQSLLGDAFLRSGRTKEAVAAFETALETVADFPAGLLGRAGAALASGEPAEAIEWTDRLGEPTGDSLHLAAKALIQLGRREEAVAKLEKALGLAPYDGRLALDLANLKQSMGETGEATQNARDRAKRFGADAAVNEATSNSPTSPISG